jgi:putative DNA primase/helicase
MIGRYPTAKELAEKLGNGRQRKEGRGWKTLCPCHDDHDPSLSITEGRVAPVMVCRAGLAGRGCPQDAIIAELRRRGLWPEKRASIDGNIVYKYEDESGRERYQVVRAPPNGSKKKFWQRRPDGAGGWINNLQDVERLPYRLPDLLAYEDAPVLIPEGEKDVDTLFGIGLVATCNSEGAGKWRPEISRWLLGRDVVILPDNDDVGRAHAKAVAKHLYAIAASIRILELPGLPEKGDVSDWLVAGGTRDELDQLIEHTPYYRADEPAEEDAGPQYSEGALALRFADAFGGEARHVAEIGKWVLWEGGMWAYDRTLSILGMARVICSRAAAEAASARLYSARCVHAVLNLARADVRHIARADQWDADPDFFNTTRPRKERSDGH